GGAVEVAAHLQTPDERTAAVDAVLHDLVDRGILENWRGEPFPVVTDFAAAPLMAMERAAVPKFGFRGYGIHVNGFVRRDDGIHMWVGRRAMDRGLEPGKLDQLVAGGQPAGLSLVENLIKEGAEEADIPADMMARSVPVGAITYLMDRPEGLRNDVLFIYDLELPSDFVPRNTDGEVDEFFLWPLEKVAETVHDTEDFKFNCAMVVIDFLIRHGKIAPDTPGYLDLVAGLRR
ncbi:MAG: DUF4743 domain-containing protein, partial [Rhodospirillales bacterium]|nr:DUF4743 domain-containing protein [Rhodospirillales bacterium]